MSIRSTVLVVEDDPDTSGLIQGLLEEEGYLVEMAADGATALACLEVGGIDILVLDQMLPRVHGLELCRVIRGHASDRYLPIIMVSALCGPCHEQNALAAGADVYLTKPFAIDELLYVVDRWAAVCRRRPTSGSARVALMPADRLAEQSDWREYLLQVEQASPGWR
jgi:DNA-binding response OmpR family regulator